MPAGSPKIVYLTAGAGGMFCGSCMHDNTLAASLTKLGADVQLVPTYTPIRTDEHDVSLDRVFFGGINVFLEQKVPLYRHLPDLVRRWVDRPSLIRWATSNVSSTNPKTLGALTVSMLKGTAGYQRAEVRKLCGWLKEAKPDLVNFTNMLIAGCVPELKRQLDIPVTVKLQGDDIFLDSLVEPHKSQAIAEIQRLVPDVDAFLVHSRFYADFMAKYFAIPSEKLRIVPLGIDMRGFPAPAQQRYDQTHSTIGYLARLAPEKGLHVLVDAFIRLRQQPAMQHVRLRIAGWLGENNREYAEQQFAKLRDAGLGDAYEYVGSVDRDEKVQFLQGLDVFSVPTTYREPKGLFVLEALAAGVPVVLPEHGAFPELLQRLGGGRLVGIAEPDELATALCELLEDHDARHELARQGATAVHQQLNAEAMGRATLDVIEDVLRG